jgi:hypothetical protein
MIGNQLTPLAGPFVVSVGTTVLQIQPGTSWSTAVAQPSDVVVSVTNRLGAGALHLKRVRINAGASMTLLANTTALFNYVIDPGATEEFRLLPGESLLAVRASGTGDVEAFFYAVVTYGG